MREFQPVPFTEDSQADKFVSLSKDTLRYVEGRGWYQRNGSSWENVSTLVIIERIRLLVRQDAGDAPVQDVMQMGSLRFVRNAERLCRGDKRCLMTQEGLRKLLKLNELEELPF